MEVVKKLTNLEKESILDTISILAESVIVACDHKCDTCPLARSSSNDKLDPRSMCSVLDEVKTWRRVK